MVGYAEPPRVITDEETRWLEEASAPEPERRSKCCARCQRGSIPYQFPCGAHLACRCHERANTG